MFKDLEKYLRINVVQKTEKERLEFIESLLLDKINNETDYLLLLYIQMLKSMKIYKKIL